MYCYAWETEEEKRKKRKLTLELAKLEFTDWSIHILAVGLYQLNAAVTHSLKARGYGFNP